MILPHQLSAYSLMVRKIWILFNEFQRILCDIILVGDNIIILLS